MALTRRTTDAQLHQFFAQPALLIDPLVIRVLRYVGEVAVNTARTLGNYRDVTGNLRASVGYIILHNGQVVAEDFGGGAGGTAARQAATEVASQHPSGFVLIVVVGMQYAVDVESRGRDVFTSGEQAATAIVPGLMADLRRQLNQAA